MPLGCISPGYLISKRKAAMRKFVVIGIVSKKPRKIGEF